MENNRRTFIKTAGMGGLGLTLPQSPLTINPWMSKKAKSKLGIALVGLGYYATHQLAPALAETAHCHLAGIVTGTPKKEGEWMAKYNIPKKNVYNYDNFEEIANNPDIDVVYVVLPNSMHAEFTIKAAKAKKHVICEKPMSVSVAEAEAMIKACKDNQVQLSIGYRLQFDPLHKKIIALSQTKEYGEVTYVNSQFGFTIGDPTQWRLKKALAGGGALMDVGIYCIQGSRYSYGQEPNAVRAQEFKSGNPKFKEVDETVTWQLEFPDGKISNSTTSYALSTNHLMVSTEKAKFTLQPAYSYGGLKGWQDGKPIPPTPVYQQALQMDGIAKSILDGKPSPVSGEEGLKDMKVLDAIYRSIAADGKRMII